jgi:cytochrome b561
MIKNTENSYGIISILLHWIVSFALIALISAGFYMTSLEPSEDKFAIYRIHKATGVIVFALVLFRIIWRLKNITPKLPDSTPDWQKAASKINIRVLYFIMITMPSSGLLMSLFSGREVSVFGLFTIPSLDKKPKLASLFNEIHDGFAVLLIITVILHISAAFYHHLVRKDNVLRRIIFGK